MFDILKSYIAIALDYNLLVRQSSRRHEGQAYSRDRLAAQAIVAYPPARP
jgi:hypothetical protein